MMSISKSKTVSSMVSLYSIAVAAATQVAEPQQDLGQPSVVFLVEAFSRRAPGPPRQMAGVQVRDQVLQLSLRSASYSSSCARSLPARASAEGGELASCVNNLGVRGSFAYLLLKASRAPRHDEQISENKRKDAWVGRSGGREIICAGVVVDEFICVGRACRLSWVVYR